jgi:DNA-binding NarL/FixJ family response regulator
VSAPRVLVAAADVLTGAGLRVALLDGGFEVVGEAHDADGAAAAAVRARPDLVLVTTDLPGDGLRAARAISSLHPGVRVVVLTSRPSGDELVEAVLAGASGYLASEGGQGRLAHALRGVLDGEVALPRRLTERLLEELRGRRSRRAALDARASRPLTDREWEVLELLTAGASTGEIAHRLSVSDVTVRRHASSAAAKLGVPDRASAVRLLSRSAE